MNAHLWIIGSAVLLGCGGPANRGEPMRDASASDALADTAITHDAGPDGAGEVVRVPCGIDSVIPRCDSTCGSCFEMLPDYSICADIGVPTQGSATQCAQPGDPYPDVAHECCNDSECTSPALCFVGVSDAQTNFPPNRCLTFHDACASLTDCEANEVCVPHLGSLPDSFCEAAPCRVATDCAPGFICAPTWESAPGNHGPTYHDVHCVPDPAACIHP